MACSNHCSCDTTNIMKRFPEKADILETYIKSLDLDEEINKNRGHLINCLHKAQHIFGYLSKDIQKYIAKQLRLTLGDVFGVISFYSFFTTEPPAKFKINICMGTACFVKGSDQILAQFEKKLGINNGSTTEDFKYSLGGLRCVGACSLAPVVLVNEKVYAKVTPDMVVDIIEDCENEVKNA